MGYVAWLLSLVVVRLDFLVWDVSPGSSRRGMCSMGALARGTLAWELCLVFFVCIYSLGNVRLRSVGLNMSLRTLAWELWLDDFR